jgi:predicted Zn-ribbon and HTH transcriptional regulator
VGSIVQARCGSCDFAVPMTLGGGMRSHKELCAFPALCSRCGAFWPVNLLARPVKCPTCEAEAMVAYDDPSLAGEPGRETVFSWNVVDEIGREVRLSSGTYLCPKCKARTLRFSRTGHWD